MDVMPRIRGERRLWGREEWLEILREEIEDAVVGLALADHGFPEAVPDPEDRPRAALVRAYAKAGITPGEVATWEERREAGEDVESDLRTLAGLRGTPWDAGCAIPTIDTRTDDEIALDERRTRQRLYGMLGYTATPVDQSRRGRTVPGDPYRR